MTSVGFNVLWLLCVVLLLVAFYLAIRRRRLAARQEAAEAAAAAAAMQHSLARITSNSLNTHRHQIVIHIPSYNNAADRPPAFDDDLLPPPPPSYQDFRKDIPVDAVASFPQLNQPPPPPSPIVASSGIQEPLPQPLQQQHQRER
ncbi:hypothetical protein BDF20DRAFT_913180 [Mycotypha africana]|uniref:uncharacterized protein n=1 Tax=Mycotypha africana TaxID=64632 RepID=UPI00230185DF|nr:uncharacterized protein BDF20DRAFT_913180 [Mycotypha africana]KAI8979640.1 hypothetical protein BDF20DRAFT_913180 [Mycotypha africana]